MINAKPKILIGQDSIHLIISREIIGGDANSSIFSHTKLGWVIQNYNE